MSKNSFVETGSISEILSGCNRTRTHNYLVRNRTLNYLAKLAKWLSICLRTKWLCVRVPLQSLNPFYACHYPRNKLPGLDLGISEVF